MAIPILPCLDHFLSLIVRKPQVLSLLVWGMVPDTLGHRCLKFRLTTKSNRLHPQILTAMANRTFSRLATRRAVGDSWKAADYRAAVSRPAAVWSPVFERAADCKVPP